MTSTIMTQPLVSLLALLKLSLNKATSQIVMGSNESNQLSSEPPRSLQPAVYVILKSLPKPSSNQDGRSGSISIQDTVTLLSMKRKIEMNSDSSALQLGVERYKRIHIPTPTAIMK
jgi:hypothetical protein